jgi:hypothetical protein
MQKQKPDFLGLFTEDGRLLADAGHYFRELTGRWPSLPEARVLC